MFNKEYCVALETITYKEVRRFLRIWVQTLLPSVITTTLYFLIFGTLIGSRIGTMNGYDYMDFIVPGLILMAVISNAYSNVVSSFYSSKFQHNIEEMLDHFDRVYFWWGAERADRGGFGDDCVLVFYRLKYCTPGDDGGCILVNRGVVFSGGLY